MIRRVLAASLWLSIGVLVGRLLGFVREAALAATFGISATTDIAVLVLTIPNILVNLLVAGGLSAALIPEFKSQKEGDAGALFVQSSLLVLLTCIFVVFVLMYLSEWLVYLFAPGMESQVAQVAQKTLRGALWLIPLTVLAGISTAFLQSQNRFAIPAMGTAIFNTSVVIGLLFFVKEDGGLSVLVIFIIAGGFFRWISQLWVLKRSYAIRGSFTKNSISKQLLHRYWQGVTAVGILTLYPIVYRSFASLEGEGELAAVNFAYRLVELPLGVVITVLSVVLLPRMAEYYREQDKKSYSALLQQGLFWSVLLASTIAGVLAGAADVFTSIVYQRGELTYEDVNKVSLFVKYLAISLPFQSIIFMSISGFNARKNTKTPMFLSLAGLIVLLPTIYLSIKILGTTGGAIAVVLCYCFVCILCLGKLGKEHIAPGFVLSLSVLITAVTYLNYSVIKISKNIFEGSNISIVFISIILFILVPFFVSMLYKDNRHYLMTAFLRRN